MRRLAPFLLAAIMASLPPSLLLLFIGGLASVPTSSCPHHMSACGDIDVAGFARGGGGSGGGGFVTGVVSAHSSSPPSHRPMVSAATTASIVSTMTYSRSGGKHFAAAEPMGANGAGTPQQQVPNKQHSQHEQGGLTLQQYEGGADDASAVSGERTVTDAPPDTLKVSVLGASRGKSEDCTYSLVEFSNTHHADTIIVHSTYIEPTAVFPPQPGLDPSSAYNDLTPFAPSFHGEYSQDQQLHIPPRTAVTIPVSIIPHWRKLPDEQLDTKHHHYHYRKLDGTELDRDSERVVRGYTRKGRGRMPNPSSSTHYDHLSFLMSPNTGPANETFTEDHTISQAIHADILTMIETSQNSGNINSHFLTPDHRAALLSTSTVHETLIANTSWGFVQMKVPYVCSPSHSKEYEFGLPNNLVFLDGGGGWYARRNTTPTVELAYMFGDMKHNPTRDHYDPFVYRLYMNNPSGRELNIYEVFTTKPELVGAKIQNHFDMTTSNPAMNDASYYYPIMRRGYGAETRTNIPIVTLRLFPEQFTPDMTSSIQDLGFLELRTNLGDFSIALDYIPNGGRGGIIHGIGDNRTTVKDVRLVQDDAMHQLLETVHSGRKPNVTIAKFYRTVDDQTQPNGHEERLKRLALAREAREAKQQGKHKDGYEGSFITAAPQKINFGSVTTGSRVIRIPVKLTNAHKMPIRIMRISVAMSTLSDDGMGNITDISNESHRMEIGVEWSDGNYMGRLEAESNEKRKAMSLSAESFFFRHDTVLPASSDYEYPIYVWCRFNAASPPSETVTPRFYTGSILIQTSEDIYIRYQEWEKQLLLDHTTWGKSPYALEIPFEGSVLPGNLGSPTESLLFPTHFYVLPVEERVKMMQRTNGKIPEFYDRELDVTNNFAIPISIIRMRIMDSSGDDFCTSRFSIPSFKRSENGGWPMAETGEKWKGLSVRYHYQNADLPGAVMPVRKCILSLETDKAGKQSLPLIIYSGEVVVDIVRPEGGQLTVHCIVTKKDGSTMVSHSGMPCMKDWMTNTIEGTTLNDAITKLQLGQIGKRSSRKKSSSRAKLCAESFDGDDDPISVYFQSLLSSSKTSSKGGELRHHTLQPIVLSFGAIPTEKTKSRSILLTNMNHAPIEISAPTAALGNMDVTIGTVPSDLQNAVKGLSKQKSDKRTDAAYFLDNNPVAKEFLSKFDTKFDIVLTPRTGVSELIALHQRHSIIDVFQNKSEYLTNYIADEEKDMECSCGFMLAIDGTYQKEIVQRKVGKKKWIIPPGSSARFVVTVKAPPETDLTNDVTPFVGTGLVLETNHGQALPIVLTYSAIAGQLRLAPVGNYTNSKVVETKRDVGVVDSALMEQEPDPISVEVPLTLKDTTITPSVDAYAQKNGVALSIESTFSQDIYLSEIRSCNKWFNVFLPSSNAAARAFFNNQGASNFLRIKGTDINATGSSDLSSEEIEATILPLGKVLSALSCSHPSSDNSFYACALAWLENRDQIQPSGCGLSEKNIVHMTKPFSNATDDDEEVGRLERRVNTVKTQAIGALRDVVAFMSVRYVDESSGKAGAESSGGYIHFSRIHMFNHAQKMWKKIASLGLNLITGHIDAKTVYFTDEKVSAQIEPNDDEFSSSTFSNESNDNHHPPLSIPVSSVMLQSALDLPQLFRGDRDDNNVGIVEFDTVHVADTAIGIVPIVNPTAMSVRVRLAAIDSIDGSFGKDKMSHKNVFVQTTPNDHHSWWTGGSYWMSDDHGHLISASHNVTIKSGAGAYVSLLNPALHTMSAFVLGCGRRCGLRNDQDSNGEEKNFSPIGAASGDTSALLGRSYVESDDHKKDPQKALGIGDPPAFSLGRVLSEVVIPPYGTMDLGPLYFRPPGRGDFHGTIYIENSLTGFEEVKVRGRGGWEKLVFLDQKNQGEGGDVEFRFGKSTLVFPGGQTGPGPVVKSVRLANHGDFPVDITRVHMASSEIMHFTHKRRHPSSFFRADSSTDSKDKKCSARGFVLPGCVDSFSNVWIENLFSWFNSVTDYFLQIFSSPQMTSEENSASKFAEEAENFYKKGFTLQPNQTQSIFVMHYPDCSFQTSYASVVFEIEGRSQSRPGRHRVGSWQQTFRQRKVELLVGYDMSASEFRHCVPYEPPATSITSIWERKIEFQLPSLIQDVLSFGLTRWTDANGNPYIRRQPIEITLLAASFLLLLFALSLDLLFTVEISTCRKTCSSWKPTCRCLARADPTSSDLVSIGKDQTKHVLLSRFKKEGVLPSHCIQSDGSFGREQAGSNISGTHSEAIFDRLNLVNESKMDENEGKDMASGLLPCGLGWRTALRRGVGLPVGLPSSLKNSSASENNYPDLQYVTRTRHRYLKKKEEQKAAAKKIANNAVRFALEPPGTKAHPTKSRDDTITNAAANGNGAVDKTAKPAAVPLLPQDRKVASQVKKKIQTPPNGKSNLTTPKAQLQTQKLPTNVSGPGAAAKKGANNGKTSVVELARKNASVDKTKNVETGKPKHQQKIAIGGTSSVAKTEQKSKVADVKSKQKQRMEAKQAKNERANKAETKKDTPKQEESISKPNKSMASQKLPTQKVSTQKVLSQKVSSQKTRSVKPVLEVASPVSSSKAKHEEKVHNATATFASPSRKESLATQNKQARQNKKAANGKSVDQQKGKQAKQKTSSKKATAKNPPQASVQTGKPSAKIAQSDADFPPLSSTPIQSPLQTPIKVNKILQKANVRPPPGLLAPPGFMDQPDLEGLSTPSSPASSPQRMSSQRSPMIKPMNDIIPGVDIIQSSPLNNDLLSFIGNDDKALDSSLFQPQPNGNSPVGTVDNSLSIPHYRPESFTPPLLESSPVATTHAKAEAPDVQALLGAGSNFNVSNFLDGILSDSTQPPPPIRNEVVQKPAEVAEPIPFQAKAIGLSLDPWNNNSLSDNTNPLAALQGAASQQESSVIAGIPLNTNAPSLLATSKLHNATGSTYAEPAYASFVSDEGGEDSDFLEPDSFYNQLLGED